MPLNRDDIINEAPITGSRGITCNRIEMRIHPVTRDILVDFHLSKITVLADNTTFEEALMPISVNLADGTGTKAFNIYNRRTGQPTGNTRTYDLMSRDLMSLFFDTYAKAPVIL